MKHFFSTFVRFSLLSSMVLASTGCKSETTPLCQKHKTKKGEPFNYTLCTVSNTEQNPYDISMHWYHFEEKKPYYQFKHLFKKLAAENKEVSFAINAGMYDNNYAPLALYVEKGHQIKAINLKNGEGNFHLMPNGVFWLDNNGIAHVSESSSFQSSGVLNNKQVAYATQSGPMLVINGKLHPKFLKDSKSKKMRNGVGICQQNSANGKTRDVVHFVNSDTWVSFYEFASLFKNKLHCKNALFLDGGSAPAIYSTDTKQHDKKYMGAMITITKK